MKQLRTILTVAAEGNYQWFVGWLGSVILKEISAWVQNCLKAFYS